MKNFTQLIACVNRKDTKITFRFSTVDARGEGLPVRSYLQATKMVETEESATEPTPVPVDFNATLLEELRASRLASEQLAREFASFK